MSDPKKPGTARRYFLTGAFLGLGSPLGLLAARYYFLHADQVLGWVSAELGGHGWQYIYMGVGTVLAMGLLGLRAGRRVDVHKKRADQWAETAARLKTLAVTDGLTGVYVRRHLLEKLEEELRRAERYKLPLAGIFVDADNFKNFNESYGHPFGDTVLQRIAHVICASVRESDIVGRYGGDEFLIALPHARAREAMAAAERIRKGVEALDLRHQGKTVPVTVSVGVIASIPHEADVLRFLAIADQALRRSKGLGKNCTILCDVPAEPEPQPN